MNAICLHEVNLSQIRGGSAAGAAVALVRARRLRQGMTWQDDAWLRNECTFGSMAAAPRSVGGHGVQGNLPTCHITEPGGPREARPRGLLAHKAFDRGPI
jgi:hypothetical protein